MSSAAAMERIAEIPLQPWLLVMGVNPVKWRQQASAAAMHA